MTPDNDDGRDPLDELFPELAKRAPKPPRIDPGRAALIAYQAPENRQAVEEYFRKADAAKASGRAAHAAGRKGETWVDKHHVAAIERGLAVQIDHVGPPTEPDLVDGRSHFDRRGRLVVVVVGVAPPDYIGCLAGGRFFAAEAKHRRARLNAPLTDEEIRRGVPDRNAVPRHQAEYLDRVTAAGGLALAVPTFVRTSGGRSYEVRVAAPWRVVVARWRSPRGGRPGVGPEDLEDFIVDPRSDCYLAPFCEAA